MQQRPTWRKELPAGSESQTCPRCDSREGFRPVTLQDKGDAGLLMLFFGGLLPYLLYSSTRQAPHQIMCDHCGMVFAVKERTDWSAMVLLFVVGGTFALLLFLWSYYSLRAY